MEFTKVCALWPERKGFHLRRSTTGDQYIFLHMHTPIEVMIDGAWVHAEKGSCILYNKNDYQEFIAKDTALLHDFFHLVGNIDQLMEDFGLKFGHIYYPINNDAVTKLMQEMEQEHLKQEQFHNDMCTLKLTELLIYLSRSGKRTADSLSIDTPTYKRFMKLRKEIHTRFDANLTVEEMAKMVNLSPSRFHSVYKAIFGISPKKDYLIIRIEHAKTLLQERKYSVADVAIMAGYNNQFHFIRQFKEIVGVTPGKYLRTFQPDFATDDITSE